MDTARQVLELVLIGLNVALLAWRLWREVRRKDGGAPRRLPAFFSA
jgi:hypothetical protein